MKTQGAKPFPKILVTLLLLAITVAAIYFLVILPSPDDSINLFSAFGEFICKYDTVLIGILVAVNLVELIDIIIFAKRDETINAVYEMATSKSIGLNAMFSQFFSGITSRAPLIFAEEERGSALPRVIINLAVSAVKFISWLALLLPVAGMIFNPAIYDFALGDGKDYAFTVLVLLVFLNCNVFIYALYRVLPLHETRTYETIYYYTDGSSSRETRHESNFIAIVFVAAILYLFHTAYYVIPLSSKLTRSIETARLSKFLDECGGDYCLWNFYSGE